MTKLLKWLYVLNVLGALLYIAVCLPKLLMGQPIYPGQTGLLGQVTAGIVLALLPLGLERWGHFRFPLILKLIYEAFIFGAVLLGTGMQFYNIPYWDKFLHLFSASMLAGLGLTIFCALTPADRLKTTIPLLLSLFAFTFGATIGVFWEFYEFTFDGLLGLNMQRFMAAGVPLVGRAALMDTMGDLFADVFGSLALALFAYFEVKKNVGWLDAFKFRRV